MYSSFSQRQSEAIGSQCEATRSNPRHQTAYSSFSNQGKQMQSEAIGGDRRQSGGVQLLGRRRGRCHRVELEGVDEGRVEHEEHKEVRQHAFQ